MEITDLFLHTQHLGAQRTFYATTLGLPVLAETPVSFTLQAGATRLTFQATDQPNMLYHLAFNIPRNTLTQAKDWLFARVPLLTLDGVEVIGPGSWNAYSLYFADPAGNIAELIARQTLPDDIPDSFGPQHLRCVSEIGLPVDDVPVQVAGLTAALGITPYKDQAPNFAPLGDEHGLFIVVRIGRGWIPTGVPAVVSPLRATIQGVQAQPYWVSGYPYEITVVPFQAI